MLITKEVEITINGSLIKYYQERGYKIFNKKTTVLVQDLPKSSKTSVEVICDNCRHRHQINYYNYYNNINKNGGEYFCTYCKKERIEKTNIEKYGVKSTLSDISTKNKIRETNIERYGVEHPLQNKDIIEKLKKTNIERYGFSTTLLNSDIREKRKMTMVSKYGSENALQSEICRNNMKDTINKRYGVISYSKTVEFKNKINNNIINRYKNNDIDIIDIEGDIYTIGCKNDHTYEIHKELLKLRRLRNNRLCTVCNPINSSKSDTENRLYSFIKDNYGGDILKNDRNTINKELDIYLPEIGLAFEYNGLYWHNELYKYKNYHNEKTNLCEEKGIQLIHIWEDDWVYKNEIVKSMVLNKLGKTENKIYGRKCEIKEVKDNSVVRLFLEKNHIQGFIGSSIKIGLFYENELVSLMTLGKPRKNMNSISKNENEYELLRFCNKLNTNVIGGASKLFKYFIKNFEPEKVVTYADRGYSNGNLYKQLGFGFIKITEPNYYYIINGMREYRFKYRKDELVRLGFNKDKTEHEIMLERKIYRIYNSGNYKFEYKN